MTFIFFEKKKALPVYRGLPSCACANRHEAQSHDRFIFVRRAFSAPWSRNAVVHSVIALIVPFLIGSSRRFTIIRHDRDSPVLYATTCVAFVCYSFVKTNFLCNRGNSAHSVFALRRKKVVTAVSFLWVYRKYFSSKYLIKYFSPTKSVVNVGWRSRGPRVYAPRFGAREKMKNDSNKRVYFSPP